VAAAAGNDASPRFRILLKSISLEWVNLIADEADNLH
jgi:hypothetical protein